MGDPFSVFHNADLTVTRTEGSRGADGYSESGTATLLDAERCDAQDTSRTTQSPDEAHEGGDLRCYVDADVSSVEAGDAASVAFDDGRTYDGHVTRVSTMDSMLVVSRD